MTDPLDRIRRFGDPVLEQVCTPVDLDAADRQRLASDADDMLAAIHAFRARHGWGRAIAAPQIGRPVRMVAVAIDGSETILLNPRMTWGSAAMTELWDDCMSLPEISVRGLRHDSVTVEYRDLDGQHHAFETVSPDLAELLQHELDHLDGILMTHRMQQGSPIVAHENRYLIPSKT